MIVPLAAILGYINKFGGKVASDAAWTKIKMVLVQRIQSAL